MHYTDFGEVIPGARKHIASARWLDALQSAEEISRCDPKAQSFAALWPKPHYERILDEGADPGAAALAHALRDVAADARRTRRLGRSTIKRILDLRELAIEALSDPESAPATDRLPDQVKIRTLLYRHCGHGLDLRAMRFTQTRSEHNRPRQWVAQRKTHFYSTIVGPCDDIETLVAGLVERKDHLAPAPRRTRPRANATHSRYHVRRITATDEIYITRRGSGTHARLILCQDSEEAYRIIANEPDRLEAAWSAWKAIPAMRPPTSGPRIGPDAKIPPVTSRAFHDKFALRGVQFGNWVEQQRREDDLVRAWLALCDLGHAIGWPAAALALDSTLGLAFGARGKGGPRAGVAHYEPVQRVINLTKRAGPGSLAHEWWHAFDHYTGHTHKAARFATETLPRVPTHWTDTAVAPLLELARALAESALPRRSKRLDERRSKPYWATMREMSARAFEYHVHAKLSAAGIANDYLVAFTKQDAWDRQAAQAIAMGDTYPYPSPEEAAIFAPFFDAALAGHPQLCQRALAKERERSAHQPRRHSRATLPAPAPAPASEGQATVQLSLAY